MAVRAPQQASQYRGIAVAAKTLAVVGPRSTAAPSPASRVPNTAAGWQRRDTPWRQAGAPPATTLVVLAATGAYRQGVATAVTTAGWPVRGGAPARVRSYAQARRKRATTGAPPAGPRPRPRGRPCKCWCGSVLIGGRRTPRPATASLPGPRCPRCRPRRCPRRTRC